MLIMKQTLNILVNNFYTEEQSDKVVEIVENEEKHLMNYKILSVAIEDDIVKMSKDEIKAFYKVEVLEWFTDVDYVIAELITTLSALTGKDIHAGYNNALVLDKGEPEFEYLVNEVVEYLSFDECRLPIDKQ